MSLMADAMLLARKDMVVEIRAGQAIASAAALATIALVLVGLAVGPDPARLRELAPSLVWIVILYAAIAVADRLDRIDRSDDAFAGFWLVLEDRRSIFVGRVLSLGVALALLQLGTWAAATVLLDAPMRWESVLLVPLSALTSFTAATATALVLALIGDAGHRSLLLPVVLLPLLVPTFLAGVEVSSAVLEARLGDAGGWTVALFIEAALFTGLGLLTYETAAQPD